MNPWATRLLLFVFGFGMNSVASYLWEDYMGRGRGQRAMGHDHGEGIVCPRCGTHNDAGAHKCVNCGNVFKRKTSPCPAPTQDLQLNTRNRNKAIKAKHIQYGPLNLSDDGYWLNLAEHWNTTPEVARQSVCTNCAAFDVSPRMEACMPGMVQNDGVLGYCHMHKFKCHSKRTCYTWAAGGPITSDAVSLDWQG